MSYTNTKPLPYDDSELKKSTLYKIITKRFLFRRPETACPKIILMPFDTGGHLSFHLPTTCQCVNFSALVLLVDLCRLSPLISDIF